MTFSLKYGKITVEDFDNLAIIMARGKTVTENSVVRFTQALAAELTAEDIDTHFEGCIGCGNCGYACAWHLATNDAKNHPKRRADLLREIYRKTLTTSGRAMVKLGLSKPVTLADLHELAKMYYRCCTMCGRCGLACPQGVSNRRITQLGKNALSQADVMPELIRQIRTNAVEHHHSYGLTFGESLGKAVQMAAAGEIEVPIDRKATYFMGCSAIVNSRYPEVIVEGIKLLKQAGIDFTMPSSVIDTGTESMTTVGDLELGREFVLRLAREANRLGCKYVIIGECGCDVRTYFVENAEILSRYGLQPVYFDALLLDAVKSGRLPLAKLDMTVTYHDPCWTARLAGYYDIPRELLRRCVTNFVEMTPNREMNYCCNGGGGSMRVFPSTDRGVNTRREVSKLKAVQLALTPAEMVVTPCATCYFSLKDTVEYHEVSMQAGMLAGIVYQSMTAALAKNQASKHAEVN